MRISDWSSDVCSSDLGATRWQILASQALEYALLASILAVVALVLGLIAAWFVIVQIFEFAWAPDWRLVLTTLGAGAVLTLGIGLLASLPLMSVRPARALRALKGNRVSTIGGGGLIGKAEGREGV